MEVKKIKVEQDMLANDYKTMNDAIETIKTSMDLIHQAIYDLESIWEGPTKDEFFAIFDTEYKELVTLISNVETFVSCVQYASGEYCECEDEVTNLVNKL